MLSATLPRKLAGRNAATRGNIAEKFRKTAAKSLDSVANFRNSAALSASPRGTVAPKRAAYFRMTRGHVASPQQKGVDTAHWQMSTPMYSQGTSGKVTCSATSRAVRCGHPWRHPRRRCRSCRAKPACGRHGLPADGALPRGVRPRNRRGQCSFRPRRSR